jgi:hypothetical protein
MVGPPPGSPPAAAGAKPHPWASTPQARRSCKDSLELLDSMFLLLNGVCLLAALASVPAAAAPAIGLAACRLQGVYYAVNFVADAARGRLRRRPVHSVHHVFATLYLLLLATEGPAVHTAAWTSAFQAPVGLLLLAKQVRASSPPCAPAVWRECARDRVCVR